MSVVSPYGLFSIVGLLVGLIGCFGGMFASGFKILLGVLVLIIFIIIAAQLLFGSKKQKSIFKNNYCFIYGGNLCHPAEEAQAQEAHGAEAAHAAEAAQGAVRQEDAAVHHIAAHTEARQALTIEVHHR